MIINCVINTRSNANAFCLPTFGHSFGICAFFSAAAAACLLRCHFPFGCILNPVIKNQFLDSHISFDRMIINGIEWEKSIRVCSHRRNKNHGLIGWGVFCNFKLPHICYQQCELVFRTCVILFITGNFSCSHRNAGFLLLSFENRLKRIQYLLINANL